MVWIICSFSRNLWNSCLFLCRIDRLFLYLIHPKLGCCHTCTKQLRGIYLGTRGHRHSKSRKVDCRRNLQSCSYTRLHTSSHYRHLNFEPFRNSSFTFHQNFYEKTFSWSLFRGNISIQICIQSFSCICLASPTILLAATNERLKSSLGPTRDKLRDCHLDRICYRNHLVSHK